MPLNEKSAANIALKVVLSVCVFRGRSFLFYFFHYLFVLIVSICLNKKVNHKKDRKAKKTDFETPTLGSHVNPLMGLQREREEVHKEVRFLS